MKWVKKREKHTDAVDLCVKKMRRHNTVCAVTPLSGKNLDDAQRPLQAEM